MELTYTKAHILNQCDTEKTIRECSASLEKAGQENEWMVGMLRSSIVQLKQQMEDYQMEYERVLQDKDYKTMERFLANLRQRERGKNNPVYSFLFD